MYEPVVGKQADEQVLDVNKGGVGTRFIASGWGNRCEHGPTPVGRDKSGPYAPPTLACLQRVHTPVHFLSVRLAHFKAYEKLLEELRTARERSSRLSERSELAWQFALDGE